MNVQNNLELVLEAVKELKALNIVYLDISKKTDFADQMVFASGTSTQHVKSIAQNIIFHYKKKFRLHATLEGENIGEWVLVDLEHTIVHIMLPETRSFYDLENLWGI